MVLKHNSVACIHLLRFFRGSSQGFYVDTVSHQLYLIILTYVNQWHKQNAKYGTFKTFEKWDIIKRFTKC